MPTAIAKAQQPERLAEIAPFASELILAKAPSERPQTPEDDTRIAPDPLAAVLPALAALGTIASIAAVHWVARDATPARQRGRRKPAAALRDLEANCLGLRDIFRRLGRLVYAQDGEGVSASLPLKFGVHGREVTLVQFAAHQQLVNDVASALVLASQNSFDVMGAIEDGAIDPPETVFFGFGEQQERLNKLLTERAGLRPTIEAGFEVAIALAALVVELKNYRRE